MPTVYDRIDDESVKLLEELTAMRKRGENHLNGLYNLLKYYKEIKVAEADRKVANTDTLFSNTEWTITDGWLTMLTDGYDIKDSANNVIRYQVGLSDLSALVVEVAGDQDPTPAPEPEGDDTLSSGNSD